MSSVVTQGDPEVGVLALNGDQIRFIAGTDADIQPMIEAYEEKRQEREELQKKLFAQYQLKDADGNPLRSVSEYLQWYLREYPDAIK